MRTVYDLKPIVAHEDCTGHRYVSDQGHEIEMRRTARQRKRPTRSILLASTGLPSAAQQLRLQICLPPTLGS
eukprot:10395311-Lingulodinium_polyedra.AAC.1